MNKPGASQYKQMAVKTANRGQILIMLYEAAIQNLRKAIAAIEKKDIAAKGQFIGKTHDIINELINTLNFEVGGQVAIDLERLYHFIIDQLIKANFENNKEPLIHAQKTLETLLSGWKSAVDEVNKSSPKL